MEHIHSLLCAHRKVIWCSLDLEHSEGYTISSEMLTQGTQRAFAGSIELPEGMEKMVDEKKTVETLEAAGIGTDKTSMTLEATGIGTDKTAMTLEAAGVVRSRGTEKTFVTLEEIMTDPSSRIGEMFDIDFLDLLTESRIIQAG